MIAEDEIIRTKDRGAQVIQEVLEMLITVAVSDTVPEVRRSVLSVFGSKYDDYISQVRPKK